MTDALVAEDSALLREVLGRIGRSDNQILLLEARDEQGALLMQWQRDSSTTSPPSTLYTFPVRLERHFVGEVRLLHDLSEINAEAEERVSTVQFLVACSLCAVALLVTLLVHALAIGPLRRIDEHVSALRRGEDPTPLAELGAAEFTNVAHALNALATGEKERRAADRQHREELKALNDAYRKFVPAEFLANLHHESIFAVRRGDQVAREMTILFADVRSFTSLSQRVGAQATFEFINDLLSRLGPSVREHHGFVDKYIGDAIMALFDDAADALGAAVSMQRKLLQFNIERKSCGLPEIQVGIGINTGPLMLGVIGEDERLEGTVVGDAVNLASRLEGLTKKYGVPVLFSEATLLAFQRETAQAQDAGERPTLAYRNVESVRAKGRDTLTPIFELFEGDTEQVRRRKEALVKWRREQEALPPYERAQSPAELRQDPLWRTYSLCLGLPVPDRRRRSTSSLLDVEEELKWS